MSLTSLAAFAPESLSVLRRHNLLVPLLQSLVTEEALSATDVPSNEQEALYKQWQGQRSLDEALAMVWDTLGWTRDDLDWQLLRPVRLQIVARERFSAKAEARFLKRKGELDHVIYSLVRCKDGALARELYLRLTTGEASFAELAQQYSDGPERLSQGIVGPKPLTQAHPELAERLRTAQDGVVIEPFSVAGWWLVTRREQLLAAEFNEQMANQMALELLQEWIQTEAQDRLKALNNSQ